MRSLDSNAMKYRGYYEAGIEKGRLSGEVNCSYVKVNYIEEGLHVVCDKNGGVAFIGIKNRNYKKIRCSLIDISEKTKRSFYLS